MTRRLSRELALQVLFQQEFAPHQSVRQGLDNFRRAFTEPPEVWSYALELLEGVEVNKQAIDDTIQGRSAHWALKRMALVDLNVMRLSTYEMRFAANRLPPGVAINEAVEISRKYGTNESGAFVNGILDQVAKG